MFNYFKNLNKKKYIVSPILVDIHFNENIISYFENITYNEFIRMVETKLIKDNCGML